MTARETVQQLELLGGLACDHHPGYYCSPPVRAKALAALLRAVAAASFAPLFG